MNIKKWKDSPGIQGTKEKLETRLEDQKLRGILTWIFEIAVALVLSLRSSMSES